MRVVDGNFFSSIGAPFGYYFTVLNSSQPLFWGPLFFLTKRFDPIFIYNLVVIVGVALTFLQVRKFFTFFNKNKYVSTLLSLIFVLSPYFFYHSRSHLDLVQVWVLLLFLNKFIRAKSFKQYAFSGVLLVIAFLVSNYLGFIGALTVLSVTIAKLILTLIKRYKKDEFIDEFKGSLVVGAVFTSILLIFVFLYQKGTFLEKPITRDVYDVQVTINRDLGDFFEFSSRPWFSFLPPEDNPLFGEYSKTALDWVKEGCGNFVCSAYFKSEHTSAFLGILNILLVLVSLPLLLKGDKKKVSLIILSGIVLYLFTLPPYFTISGVKFFLPSFVIWKFLPVFRTLVRANVVTLLFFLVLVGDSYLLILKKSKLSRFVLLVFVAFSLVEFMVPIKMYDLSSAPKVYTHLQSLEGSIVVYPFSRSDDALFWVSKHQKDIVNPYGIVPQNSDIDYKKFTENLATEEGLQKAKELGTDYLVHFYEETSLAINPFDESPMLVRVGEFIEGEYRPLLCNNKELGCELLKVSGVTTADSAVLYKFLD